MKTKIKYYLCSFLLWKTRKQIQVYGVYENMYNFIQTQSDSIQKFRMMWILFCGVLKYEYKIEKNLGYIEKLQK